MIATDKAVQANQGPAEGERKTSSLAPSLSALSGLWPMPAIGQTKPDDGDTHAYTQACRNNYPMVLALPDWSAHHQCDGATPCKHFNQGNSAQRQGNPEQGEERGSRGWGPRSGKVIYLQTSSPITGRPGLREQPPLLPGLWPQAGDIPGCRRLSGMAGSPCL